MDAPLERQVTIPRDHGEQTSDVGDVTQKKRPFGQRTLLPRGFELLSMDGCLFQLLVLLKSDSEHTNKLYIVCCANS